VLELVFVKVSSPNRIVTGLEGYVRSVSGLETLPKAGSCCMTGIPRPGHSSAKTMKVTVICADPVLSLATRPNVVDPVSSEFGVPAKLRLALFKTSHVGAFDKLYVISPVFEVKVEDENENWYGFATRATGGTCEFIGKAIPGVALVTAAKQSSKTPIILIAAFSIERFIAKLAT
jgi:hypothetical protein